MTLDELLTIPSKDWDNLSDDDLRRILQPFFSVTRPDPKQMAARASTGASKTKASKSVAADLLSLARQLGLNLPSPPTK